MHKTKMNSSQLDHSQSLELQRAGNPTRKHLVSPNITFRFKVLGFKQWGFRF